MFFFVKCLIFFSLGRLLCLRGRTFTAGMPKKIANKTNWVHTEKSNKIQQCIKIYYSIFIQSSTCFGRHTAHHQEPKTSLAASGFAYVEGCWTCGCWTLSGRVLCLMMGGVSPETCCDSYKYGIINFDTLLHLVEFFCMNSAMIHGSTNTNTIWGIKIFFLVYFFICADLCRGYYVFWAHEFISHGS